MSDEEAIPGKLPDSLKLLFRRSLLEQEKNDDGLGLFELSLFEFYSKENEATIEQMLTAERQYVQEQVQREVELVNDSGIVAAEYFTKRIRYSDVIYLCSLVETFLVNACKKIVRVLDKPGLEFEPGRGVGKWRRCEDFLAGQGCVEPGIVSSGALRAMWIVRNVIVHDNGEISGLRPDEIEILQPVAGLDLRKSEVEIEREFIDRSFAVFKDLVRIVREGVNSLIDARVATEYRNGNA